MTEDHKTVVKAAVSRYIMSDWSEDEYNSMKTSISDVIQKEAILITSDDVKEACDDASEFLCDSIRTFIDTELSKLITILHPFWKLEAVKAVPETAVLRVDEYIFHIYKSFGYKPQPEWVPTNWFYDGHSFVVREKWK